jgi:hypothetical protein
MVNCKNFAFSFVLISILVTYLIIVYSSLIPGNEENYINEKLLLSNVSLPDKHETVSEIILSESKNTTPRRLLFMTASYSFTQFHSLLKVLDCLRDICNGGWDVSVLLQTASGLNESHSRYSEITDRMYCLRTQKSIPIVVEQFGQIGFGLNSKHRAYMQSHLHDFDYFSFAEEDMLLTLSHLNAFVVAQEQLRVALGTKGWLRHFIGFIRLVNCVLLCFVELIRLCVSGTRTA